MDVTALLNENLAAVDQQKPATEETLRLPTRSRTPWDAGGYSLPLNTSAAMKSPPTQHSREIEYTNDDDTTTSALTTARPFSNTSTLPFHKFTDSRSSLSSFTSSTLHSASHSRYSSISTLNSPRSLSVSLSEQLMLSPKALAEREEGSYFRLKSRSDGQDHSPNRPLDALAQIAEHQSTEDVTSSYSQQSSTTERRASDPQPEDVGTKQWRPSHHRSVSSGGASHHSALPVVNIWTSIEAEQQVLHRQGKNSGEGVLGERQVNDIVRPSSPSDTLLIKRPSNASSHFDIHDSKLREVSHSNSLHPARSHKRAISAPNFAALGLTSHRSPMPHEPTPPGSQHPEYESPHSAFQQSPPATPPMASAHFAHAEPTCMYIDDCDTDSPQRKAISHIFGRNKMCTRMIPEHLWVHLCRKHYQRCRYRDQNKWAKVQCDLVQLQIRRIHDWSLENQHDPNGIRLVGWSLTMRKREKVRREKAALAKRKREEDGDVEEKAAEQDLLDLEYNSVQTQVPDWLVKHCDQEFNTQGILAIFNRLHQEVLDGHVGPQFPDIELLPNLITPEDIPKAKKATTVGPKKAHQRSQSMIIPSSHESRFRDHSQKRQRREELTPERVLHSLPVRQAVRRPTYPSIHEDVETGYGPQTLAPQPQSRRFDSNAITSQLESGGFQPRSRPTHQRSQSEFYSGHQTYMRSPPSSYRSSHTSHQSISEYPHHAPHFDSRGSHDEYEYQQMTSNHEAARYRHYDSPPRRVPTEYEQRERAFGHHRHSSTPAQSQYASGSPHRSSTAPFSSRIQHEFRMPEHRESEEIFGGRY